MKAKYKVQQVMIKDRCEQAGQDAEAKKAKLKKLRHMLKVKILGREPETNPGFRIADLEGVKPR